MAEEKSFKDLYHKKRVALDSCELITDAVRSEEQDTPPRRLIFKVLCKDFVRVTLPKFKGEFEGYISFSKIIVAYNNLVVGADMKAGKFGFGDLCAVHDAYGFGDCEIDAQTILSDLLLVDFKRSVLALEDYYEFSIDNSYIDTVNVDSFKCSIEETEDCFLVFYTAVFNIYLLGYTRDNAHRGSDFYQINIGNLFSLIWPPGLKQLVVAGKKVVFHVQSFYNLFQRPAPLGDYGIILCGERMRFVAASTVDKDWWPFEF